MIAPGVVALSHHLGKVLEAHYATIEERQQIADAATSARKWTDLPAAVQDLIVQIEHRPSPWPAL